MQKSFFLAIAVLLFAFSGCASEKTFAKGFIGIPSVDNLRVRTEGRFSGEFDMPYSQCFNKAILVVKGLKAEIFHKNINDGSIGADKFDVSFPKCLDATELGIFITKETPGKTKIDVVSKNSELSEFVFKQIYSKLKS